MEYLLNWMVLLLSLGAITLVAFVCYLELARSSSRAADVVVRGSESIGEPVLMSSVGAGGPYLELTYRRGGVVEHVQRVYAGQSGYIGTETCPALGSGMPVRCAEIMYKNDAFYCTNLDWQTSIRLLGDAETAVELPMSQPIQLDDGAELELPNGWLIGCRACEEVSQ